MSLFARFFLILLAFAMIPLVATGIWVINSNEAVRENARQLHQQVASLSAQTLEIMAVDINRQLGFVQYLENNASHDQRLDGRILQRAAAVHAAFELLAILDSSGKEIVRIAD